MCVGGGCVHVEDVYRWRMFGYGGCMGMEWVWNGCGGCMGVEGVCVCESLCAYTWKHLLMRNGVAVCVGGKRFVHRRQCVGGGGERVVKTALLICLAQSTATVQFGQ